MLAVEEIKSEAVARTPSRPPPLENGELLRSRGFLRRNGGGLHVGRPRPRPACGFAAPGETC